MAANYLFEDTQFFDNVGNPLAGGLISFFAAGTSTPMQAFTDASGVTPLANPATLDSAGRLEIWLSAASYKIVIAKSNGVVLETIDNYNAGIVAGNLTEVDTVGDVNMLQTTAATSGTNQSSNVLRVKGSIWNGSSAVDDVYTIRNVTSAGTNPATAITVAHSGTSGTASVNLGSLPLSAGPVTGTSLALGGGTALTTTNQTGTGNLVLATSPTLVTPNIGAATGTSLTATGQLLSNGSVSAPAHSYVSETGSGWFWQQAGIQGLARQGTYLLQVNGNKFSFGTGQTVSFSSGSPNSVSPDVGISRTGVGVLALGNSGNGDTSGTLQLAGISNIILADGLAGADLGAKINAAVTKLAGNPGEIWVTRAAGTTLSTAVTLAAQQVLVFKQGGTYTLSAAINLGQGCGIVGVAAGGNLTATMLQAAASSNMAAMVNMGQQCNLKDITLDGNKANNPTGGVGIRINQVSQTRLSSVLVQNFKSHGIFITSSLSGDESTVPKFHNCLILANDGDGLHARNTTDGFLGMFECEQNGLGGNPVTGVTVNTAGTTVTWVSGPKWSTDTSLVGTFIRINGAYFLVSAIASTTSLTVSVSPGTLTGVPCLWGNGVEMGDCPGWRFEHSDFAGSANNGMLFYGTDAGRGSGQEIIVGNQYGGSRGNDIEFLGFGTAAYVAVNNTITGNMFLGSLLRVANTFSAIRMQDCQDDVIVSNVFRPANTKAGVEVVESAGSRAQKITITGNSFIASFGTGAFLCSTANNGQNCMIAANAEGNSASATFGSGASSLKIQGGILNSGTGVMHFRGTSVATGAGANANSTTTITWPGTWNDTNYTAVCSLDAPTSAAGVVWLGAKTITTMQVQVGLLMGNTVSATGEIDCIAIHD